MAMNSSDLFLLRSGLVEAGMKPDAAEKVAIAMEGAVALSIDQVLQKWSTKAEHDMVALRQDMAALRVEVKSDIEIVKRDMTIRLGLMIFGAVGLILSGMKLFF